MHTSIKLIIKVGTRISEVFVINFGLYFGYLWRVRLFLMHFGLYFGCYFGFFTSEYFSELFVMHFGFLDEGPKKKKY